MHHLHQLLLRAHHRIDVLVGHGDLVDHLLVFAAFHMSRGPPLVFHGESALGLGPAHHPAGTMAAGTERFLVAQPSHDEALGAHRAGNDAQLPFLRRHRPFARHQHFSPKMLLALHIVVVAVHRFQAGFKRFAQRLASRTDHCQHHQLAVLPGVVLRPLHRFDVVGEMAAALLEIRKVLVRQVGQVLAHVCLGQFDEQVANGIAHAPGAAVQHEPDAVGLVQAHLDEMVAAAQRPQVMTVIGLLQPRVLVGDGLEAPGQLRPGLVRLGWHIGPGALVTFAEGLAMRHGVLDGIAQAMQVVRQVAGVQRRARGDHAAADIHTHRSGNDCANRGNDAADGRALAQVHVRHNCQVLEDERHLGRVEQLLAGIVFDRYAVGPQLDRLAAGDLENVHGAVPRMHTGMIPPKVVGPWVASEVAMCCMLGGSSGRGESPHRR